MPAHRHQPLPWPAAEPRCAALRGRIECIGILLLIEQVVEPGFQSPFLCLIDKGGVGKQGGEVRVCVQFVAVVFAGEAEVQAADAERQVQALHDVRQRGEPGIVADFAAAIS